MGAKATTKLILAFRSGDVCAFTACGKKLTYNSAAGEDTYVGEAAHIRGENLGAARYDPTMTDLQRNSVDNLVYLCPYHHTLIDKDEADWPVAALLKMKEDHERRVTQAMDDAFPDVAFPELVNAVSWVLTQAPKPNGSFHIIAPDEKIKKNALSAASRHIIAAGLTACATVREYVEAETQNDPDFPDRLRAGFLARYYALQYEGHRGDELFELMCAFAQRGMLRPSDRIAGLSVLIYLFEICDVFEK